MELSQQTQSLIVKVVVHKLEKMNFTLDTKEKRITINSDCNIKSLLSLLDRLHNAGIIELHEWTITPYTQLTTYIPYSSGTVTLQDYNPTYTDITTGGTCSTNTITCSNFMASLVN